MKHAGCHVFQQHGGPTVMTAPLPPLSPGEYHIEWFTMARADHEMKGEVTYEIK